MYKIAVIDDIEFDLFKMKNFLEECPEFESTMNIETFSSGVEFLDDSSSSYDLILMDMQMNVLEGFHTAVEMRKFNNTAVLCFCSAVLTPQTEHF